MRAIAAIRCRSLVHVLGSNTSNRRKRFRQAWSRLRPNRNCLLPGRPSRRCHVRPSLCRPLR